MSVGKNASRWLPIWGGSIRRQRKQAERQLGEFTVQWDKRHPAISQIWRRNWTRVIPFFAFPPEIRKVIYATNAIELLHMTLRKVSKDRASFANEEAAMKLLYTAVTNVSGKWHVIRS